MIRMRNLSKTYRIGNNTAAVLDNMNLDIEDNEFTVILGKSGSGKSTLLYVIAFLESFDNGEYYFAGKSAAEMSESEKTELRCRNIGFVFQSSFLIPSLSCYDNLEIPMSYAGIMKSIRKKRIEETLERVGMADFKNQNAGLLSGGQKQRVAIARAIINKPSLILADEPTGNLDGENAVNIMKILKKENMENGTTTLMVTHDTDLISYADKIIRISDGKITQ